MDPCTFLDPRVQEVFNSYKFTLCDPKYAINETDTETIEEQENTEESCRKAKAEFESVNGEGEPKLFRKVHAHFLLKCLNGLPHDFVSLEGSRTWIVYWCLNGLRILNYPIDHTITSNIITFIAACQNPTGGFGGSPSHIPHIATTYAAVMALASIGTEEALAVINRKTLYDFILSLKQPNGSFIMHKGGEVDIRGVYCAVAVASLTRIIDPKLFEGTPAWVLSCQTYEGGFAAEPFVEAHGGYTYCAVAALALFGKLKMMDIDKLLRWSAARQMPYEGGFQGRSNKLVDACYSFWMAAIFPILDYELHNMDEQRYNFGGIFEPDGLQWYLLSLCQSTDRGGIRDKPEKNPDAYHTCYALAGLSIAQHYSMREKETVVGGSDNAVEQINPLYNIVCEYHQFTYQYFEKQPALI